MADRKHGLIFRWAALELEDIMLATFTRDQISSAGPAAISDELEKGRIVCFPECPIALPSEPDLVFLREEMPRSLKLKNISYHPEADRIYGIKGHAEIVQRAHGILKVHSGRVQEFLKKVTPNLAREWMVGTSSFRPLQERGRNLAAHASNELVHVDAGAYGATHGDRIIRFFVNVNPVEDRVWVSKGAFPDLYARYAREARVSREDVGSLEEGPIDRFRTASLQALAAVAPVVKLLDSSPYDRAMRRFHNFMKDTPAFQESREMHHEFAFKSFTAWMVFTDMVSHACISGQHAFVDTFVVPLRNLRMPHLAPISILKGLANGGSS
jgi:hypothetical protein